MNGQFSPTAIVGVFLLIVLVGAIPLGIWFSLRSQITHQQMNLFRKATGRMRRPWEKEDAMFQELNDRVTQLKYDAPREDDK
jgi:hypothetical protein